MNALFTRISAGLKAHFDPLHDTEDALLFWIEEVSQPRDTGSLVVACRGRILTEIHGLDLNNGSTTPILNQLSAYSSDLRLCTASRIAFRNVAPWLQTVIRNHLDEMQIKVNPL